MLRFQIIKLTPGLVITEDYCHKIWQLIMQTDAMDAEIARVSG